MIGNVFLLFLATLLFGIFNIYINLITGDARLKRMTLFLVYVSIWGELTILIRAFVLLMT